MLYFVCFYFLLAYVQLRLEETYCIIGGKMNDDIIMFMTVSIICLVFALCPFILFYMWSPERLKRLEEESKLKSTKI